MLSDGSDILETSVRAHKKNTIQNRSSPEKIAFFIILKKSWVPTVYLRMDLSVTHSPAPALCRRVNGDSASLERWSLMYAADRCKGINFTDPLIGA